MSLINVQNLTFSYDGGYKNVFENVSFQIDTDWKLGFVGRNGRGKTTFLNILTGQYDFKGTVSANAKFTYFPFEVQDKSRTVSDILHDICPAAEDWEFLREFSYLQIAPDTLYSAFDTLSCGEQTKALLAALFLNDGNFLLIDEPTNHLDAEGRKTVSQYLNGKKSFIAVSHDREFLDGCVDHIISINRKNIEITSGNFSCFLENFNRRQAFESAQNDRLQKEILGLSSSSERTAQWAMKAEKSKYGKASSGLKQDKGYVGHKAAKVMKSAKVTEARQLSAAECKQKLMQNVEKDGQLKLTPLTFRLQKLACSSDVQITYDGQRINLPVNFEIEAGDRIALDGKNGCGKSSVLKLIAGEDVLYDGTVTLQSGLIISYLPQTSESVFGTVESYAESHGLNLPLFRAVLDKTGFEKDDLDGEISRLSEGQKKKIMIAKCLCTNAHLYVWDEPLNYLDIFTRIQLEKLICEYCPTMIFVEHDGAFRRAVATKTVNIRRLNGEI